MRMCFAILCGLFWVTSLRAVDFEYVFEAAKNPLEIFKVNPAYLRDKQCVVEPYDDVWILKNQNVNSGLMLWKEMNKGKVFFEGSLLQGGMRLFALYAPSTGHGIALYIPSANSREVRILSTLSGKSDILAKGELNELPRELEISLEITDDMIKVCEEGKLICEAKRPPEAKTGSFGIMGTWGTRLKLDTFSIRNADLR